MKYLIGFFLLTIAFSVHAEISEAECRLMQTKYGYGLPPYGYQEEAIKDSILEKEMAQKALRSILATSDFTVLQAAQVGLTKFRQSVALETVVEVIGDANSCEGKYSGLLVQYCSLQGDVCATNCEVRWKGQDCR